MKAPNPGKGWRLLKVGERIPKDAEYELAGEWVKTSNPTLLYNADDRRGGLLYRTKVPDKKPVNRLALKMSKSKTIREAREIYKKAVGR